MARADQTDQAPDYLYKEYVRLATSLEGFVRSSFEDFKLLGAIGVIAAWPPLADWLSEDGGPSRGLVLFGGFTVILLVVAIIATRDLLKQSIMEFHLLQMRDYERALKQALGVEAPIFDFSDGWKRWHEQTHHPIAVYFAAYFLAVLIVFPTAVLLVLDAAWYALLYGVVFLVVVALYERARRRLLAARAARGRP